MNHPSLIEIEQALRHYIDELKASKDDRTALKLSGELQASAYFVGKANTTLAEYDKEKESA